MKRIVKRLIVLVVMLYITSCMKKSDEKEMVQENDKKYREYNFSGGAGLYINNGKFTRINDSVYSDESLCWYGEGSGAVGVTHPKPFEYYVQISSKNRLDNVSIDSLKKVIKVYAKEGEEDNFLDMERIEKLINAPYAIRVYFRPPLKKEGGDIKMVVDKYNDTSYTKEYIIMMDIEGKKVELKLNSIENSRPRNFVTIVHSVDEVHSSIPPFESERTNWKTWLLFVYPNEGFKHFDKNNMYGDDVDIYI